MACKVCEHARRADIEKAILSVPEVTLEAIAEEFGLTVEDVKMHTLMHTTAPDYAPSARSAMDPEPEALEDSERPTIARQLKLREADMLLEVVDEYMVTLKTVGRQIQVLSEAEGMLFSKMLGKPVVDLYIGVGGEIRATVKTLAELNSILNGPENSAAQGLSALAAALTRSVEKNG